LRENGARALDAITAALYTAWRLWVVALDVPRGEMTARTQARPSPAYLAAVGESAPTYVCRPGRPSLWATLREIWQFRRLLYIFVWRDLKVRYRHTFIGAMWNIIQPLGMMLVFTFVFGVLFTHRIADIPYPLFLYAALLLWQFFARALAQGGTSLESFQSVLNKVYFPKMIAPISFVLSALVDFLVAAFALGALMVFYGAFPTWHILFAPVFLVLTAILGLGLAVWLTALDANYKDVRHTLSFVTQFWMFATPVVYPLGLIPERFHSVYSLNPMVGLVEGFRWSVTSGTDPPTAWMLLSSLAFGLVVLFSGMKYFNSREGTLMDTV
jgi:lipopolysaccharide transport system permease protein